MPNASCCSDPCISVSRQGPSKTTQRFSSAAAASWAQREFCCSPHSLLYSAPSLPLTLSSWVSKAKMREKLTTLQYWRCKLYTRKSWDFWNYYCGENDTKIAAVVLAEMLGLDICNACNQLLIINMSIWEKFLGAFCNENTISVMYFLVKRDQK